MSHLRRGVSALIAVLSLATASILVAEPAYAGTAPSGCTTVKQLGATDYVPGPDGTTAASVKQFYGNCSAGPRNWSYVWIWDQAMAKWDTRVDSTGIWAELSPGNWSSGLGVRWGGKGQQQVISDPTNTVHLCTEAFAWIGFYTTGGRFVAYLGQTAKVC